jgi:hypothetical protein
MPAGKLKEKNMGKFFFASLKSLKKGIGPGVGSNPDPIVRGTDPHQNVTDPEH